VGGHNESDDNHGKRQVATVKATTATTMKVATSKTTMRVATAKTTAATTTAGSYDDSGDYNYNDPDDEGG